MYFPEWYTFLLMHPLLSIVILCVVLLVALGGMGYLFYKSRKENDG